ncbi:MAG: polysaccharide biosynthesis/export family protein [Phycisphaerae bacterium]|nr:polysaccharide biosynthesis/export family protein [Phycisphaerae bacterium]
MSKAKDGLIVPILDRLNNSADTGDAQFAHAQSVTADDLVSNSSDYVIGKNDLLNVSITDLVGPGIESVRQVRVTESGKISMPLVPQINASGLTEAQLEQAIVAAYRDANLISNAQVSVTVVEARARTFTISGAIAAPGEYSIVRGDFRILDALALAHEVTSTTGVDEIYVIRRNSTTSGAAGSTNAPAAVPTTAPGNDMLAPRSEGPQTPTHRLSLMVMAQETTAPNEIGSIPPPPAMNTNPTPDNATGQPAAVPAVTADSGATPATMPSVTASTGGEQEGRYVIIDGKPVMVDRNGTPAVATTMPGVAPMATADTGAGTGTAGKDFEFNAPTEPNDQRIIRVPVDALRRGELKYNIVVRPGDYIYVPQPVIGEYYMGGHVLRTGVYSLTARKITLKEAFISAGMLDPVAIPARTQIIRRIGDKKEIFAVVDIEKIFAGTESDLILRPDDQVIVGTNIIAPFLAAIRNGFRITYGFGFLYDRNYYTGNGSSG